MVIAFVATTIIATLVMAAWAADPPASTYLPFNNKQIIDIKSNKSYIYPTGKDYLNFSYSEDVLTGNQNIVAQRLDKDGKELWKQTIKLKGQSSLEMVHLYKNGFAMVVKNQLNNIQNIRLYHIENSGNIMRQQDLPLDEVNSIASTNDDGLIIAGTLGKDKKDIKIIKLDKLGTWKGSAENTSRWEKTYPLAGSQQANQIIQVLDKDAYNDGYIFTGYTDKDTKGKKDLYLVRLNAYGEVKWSKNYGSKEDDEGTTIGMVADASNEHIGYLIAGNTRTSTGKDRLYLIYVDKYGYNQGWPNYQVASDGAKERFFGESYNVSSLALLPVPDAFKNSRKLRDQTIEGHGGIILLGYNVADKIVYAVRIDGFGHVLWEKKLDIPGDNLIITTLSKGDSKEQIIAYSAKYPATYNEDLEVYTLKLSLAGEVEQDKATPKADQLESNYEKISWVKSSLKYDAMRDISKEIKDLLNQQPLRPVTAVDSLKGEIEWPDNSYYLGNLVIGKADGEGTLFFTNGVWYQGEWKNNMFYGNGYLRFPSGENYEGQFVEHMMQGKGTFNWPTGEIYAGEFINNQKDGQGKFSWADGTYYEGGFSEDKASGMGAIYWTNGERYEGQMSDGNATGRGSYYFPTGEYYRGEIKNLVFDGVGTYHWPDGSYYVGQFANDRLNGEGYYVWSNGVQQWGYWKDDRYLGTNPEAEKTRGNW